MVDSPTGSSAQGDDQIFAGGGEMGARMRAMDWSKTPLGPPDAWPRSLKTTVRILLTSRYAMFVWWGHELVNLYNDAYAPVLGARHPAALGGCAREIWAEIWPVVGLRAERVLLHGEATFDEGLLLIMERHGYPEETYFTFSYSPVPGDDGGVGGVFCACNEETSKVIGGRRMSLLRELAASGARVHVDGPKVALSPDAAQSAAMMIHELATNAAKYGALSSPAGRLNVVWSWTPNGSIALDWIETGGPAAMEPSRRGMGSNVIERTITQQLGGTVRLDWRPAGLRCEIVLPAAAVVRFAV